ncbi:hypothetical protein BL253_15100 [Pseudofrankia asymbiotica]|uniref:Uncharacterized protein n=1 Tax=Pseudofrankia asymbiotica TaxID=1834516 RepID=A0A1V2IAV6_9ACTN|nr:hypothetical protein BL253_15100 [Pseudofrankia asymbiotica]
MVRELAAPVPAEALVPVPRVVPPVACALFAPPVAEVFEDAAVLVRLALAVVVVVVRSVAI